MQQELRIGSLYALFNLGVAYALLVIVGGLELQNVAPVAVAGAGFGLWSVSLARSVTKLRSSSQSRPQASHGNDGGSGAAA